MIENLIPRLLGWVPVSLRRTIIGRPDKPSRAATLVHRLLNRMPRPKAGAASCRGALQGYQMSVDWERFRSFVYGTWEPNAVKVVSAEIKPGMRIVDVGAHIGYYTLLFAKCAGPSGRVASFCASTGFRPDFLKIDVEGAEYEVLEVLMGGKEVIAEFHPIMLIELHHFDGNLVGHPVPSLLAQSAYDIKWIDRWELTSHILAIPHRGHQHRIP